MAVGSRSGWTALVCAIGLLGACAFSDTGGLMASPSVNGNDRATASGSTRPVPQGRAAGDLPSSPTGSNLAPLGEIGSEQPCIASGTLAPSGISLQELVTLTVGVSGDFEDNSAVVDRLVYEEGHPWDSACEAVQQFGRLIGYGNHDEEESEYEPAPENEDNEETVARIEARRQVTTAVHLFQTERGARDFIRWYQRVRPWIGDNPKPTAHRLTAAGPDGVLVTSVTQYGREQVALVRRSTIVGEAAVIGLVDRPAPADASKLAMTLAKRIGAAGHADPADDVSQVMSALMPISGWGPDYAGWSWLNHSPQFGGCEACEGIDGSGISYDATYQRSDVMDSYVSTDITRYSSTAEAQAALNAIAAKAPRIPEAVTFEVPGVAGAVGIQHWSDYWIDDPDTEPATGFYEDSGYLWEVHFPHGRFVGHVFIDYAATDQASQDHDLATITRIAQAWTARLDAILDD